MTRRPSERNSSWFLHWKTFFHSFDSTRRFVYIFLFLFLFPFFFFFRSIDLALFSFCPPPPAPPSSYRKDGRRWGYTFLFFLCDLTQMSPRKEFWLVGLLFWINCISNVIESYNVPCTFNTMCMCWVQDDDDFTKMDITCMGVPFARFPGTYTGFSFLLFLFSFFFIFYLDHLLRGSS